MHAPPAHRISRGNEGLSRRAVLLAALGLAAGGAAPAGATNGSTVRAMWVWRTDDLMARPADREAFLEAALQLRLTEVFLYLRAGDYTAHDDRLAHLLTALARIEVRAWGMEGWRGYFSDADGPAGLYAAADAMIAYNRRHRLGFAGFHSDLEPQDGQGVGGDRFTNGVAESDLSPSQLSARDGLLAEWHAMHARLRATTAAAGLDYGAALPDWVDNYEGEPVTVAWQGERQSLLRRLLGIVPQYVVMSYNTNPAKVVERIRGELRAADRGGEPRIVFGLETHAGAGVNVSYADTSGKRRRARVMADIETIASEIAGHPSFLGWAIHDWQGWRTLPP
jgi:hypothetical protein